MGNVICVLESARVNWLGLNWEDILLNTAVLAIIPLLLAAFGGHLAADAIEEQKKKRNVKLCFWALFVFGIVATFWQQFRAAQADLAGSENSKFLMAVALSKMYPPPAAPVIEERNLTVQPSPRSYLAISGVPAFAGRNPNLQEGSNFQAGDPLGFNLHYRATGPNAIYVGGSGMMVLLEPDDNPGTLKKAYQSFIERVAEDKKKTANQEKDQWRLFIPGAAQFNSALAWDGPKEHPTTHVVTQTELDNLKSGALVAVVIAVFDYKDGGKIHHLWYCSFLQPPAQPPGIWHGFDACPDSD